MPEYNVETRANYMKNAEAIDDIQFNPERVYNQASVLILGIGNSLPLRFYHWDLTTEGVGKWRGATRVATGSDLFLLLFWRIDETNNPLEFASDLDCYFCAGKIHTNKITRAVSLLPLPYQLVQSTLNYYVKSCDD